MKIIFIRHGEPDYSIDSLTEKGWKEAYALADRIQKWDVKDFYVSDVYKRQQGGNSRWNYRFTKMQNSVL